MKIIFILLFILILSGCGIDKTYTFKNVSSSECIVRCSEIMKKGFCISATPLIKEEYQNNELLNVNCECVVLDCYKEMKE